MFKAIIIVVVVLVAAGIGYFVTALSTPGPWGSGDLPTERAAYETRIFRNEPAPQEYADETPPAGVEAVEFPSGDLTLQAWVAGKRDGVRHPAVVFAHGGFAFGAEDFEQAAPFRQAGYVVMAPMVRGENGNPGRYEGFWGEVDDIVAAGDYLANRDDVDVDRIFVCGHSTGGTLSMLAAMVPSKFKAAASFGGSPDQAMFFRSSPGLAPFDPDVEAEVALRSPLRFPASLRCPLTMYVGEGDGAYLYRSRQLEEAALAADRNCTLVVVPGDHFSSIDASIEGALEVFGRL